MYKGGKRDGKYVSVYFSCPYGRVNIHVLANASSIQVRYDIAFEKKSSLGKDEFNIILMSGRWK